VGLIAEYPTLPRFSKRTHAGSPPSNATTLLFSQLYRRFSHVLLLSIVVSTVWVCWQMLTIVSDALDERWATLWIFDAFWHLLYFGILLAICYLWSPTKNNQQYAYFAELGQEEDLQAVDNDESQ